MADNPGPGVTFGRIAGAVPVSDIAQALGFYTGILGMSVTFTNGDPVGFVILKRDAAELHLTLVKGHQAGRHNVAHLMVADATALHEHLVSNGVRIVKGLRDADYGLRGFVMADPDGNRIDVGQRLPRLERGRPRPRAVREGTASAMASSGSTGALSGVCGETTATPGVRTRPAVPRALTLTPEPCSSAASPVVSRSSDALHIPYGTQPSLAQSGYGGPIGWRRSLADVDALELGTRAVAEAVRRSDLDLVVDVVMGESLDGGGDTVNVLGSGCSLGHPVAMTGTRMVLTLSRVTMTTGVRRVASAPRGFTSTVAARSLHSPWPA